MPEPCDKSDLSAVIAGPILRRVSATRLGLWLVTREDVPVELALFVDDAGDAEAPTAKLDTAPWRRTWRLGEAVHIQCIDVDLAATDVSALPTDTPIGYDLAIGDDVSSLAAAEPGLCHAGERRPRFVLRDRLRHVLHGSCRRPHHDGPDGMARADAWVGARRADVADWPDLLLLTGDQIYADDVAGPLLRAIHAAISRLGLLDETLHGATVADSQALYASPRTYYGRNDLLPKEKSNALLRERFFGGTRKPVFTSACSSNHLVTLAEMVAMYLLTWSDAPWRGLAYDTPALDEEDAERYRQEAAVIDRFVAALGPARRLMANVPTAMIFDDHDVTDDWNLTADWESSAYGHPFSRRIIGNALVAYVLCQGWMNRPGVFDERLAAPLADFCAVPDTTRQDALIDATLAFDQWHYTIETSPAIVVLDTRMHRWRRRIKTSNPSGLMDWESLIDMQNTLSGRQSAIIVSAAPVFGVKLIENVQRIFTFFGKPLMVDAENWMAHRGAAVAMLQILSHRHTPENFTILSGDVHYSFVYDVTLRKVATRQRIWQIVSSGVKNEFPQRLLSWFDRLNRWLYSPWSPLNMFTKRRRLRVSPQRPAGPSSHRRLVNRAGMGYVGFDEAGCPREIVQLGADGQDTRFRPSEDIET
ncbi:alkaline phosphatase family protein [Salinisphaera sp. Q1T1-3]|uniref:alkaline phosphatase family protein n=1 Tax=Salinisphaera sp. Q1T1-3 TaxID=2321229 RepID=UPI000E707CC8|nr:alkaline phosphatase family protein [Salinisphaera sp. Q1T1-3]RJS95067.1 alkaline phosphatase family protein [Salinisphaera sp. Q1T1-3]